MQDVGIYSGREVAMGVAMGIALKGECAVMS